jgi:hypothetical protein
MEVNVESLQRQLSDRIEALDKQRKEQAEQFNKEVAERALLADMERAQQVAVYQENERRRNEKKAAEEAAEQLRVREATKAKIALENSLAAAEEARRLQEVKLSWLVEEISKQEFIEEQHKKAMQSPAVVETAVLGDAVEINVEHPAAPDNKGNAVQGTTGDTPENSLMSDHLKQILRQAQRC